MTNEGRYIIEANDTEGRVDYDRSDDKEAMIALAKQISPCEAQVIDSLECTAVWTAPDFINA
jgi:hypothetical protein